MSDFPWPEPLWRPSAESQTATVDGAPYAVTLEIAPPEALDLAWQQLAGELTGTGSALSDGGAALVRLGTGGVSVVSGGEDALDSLSWTVNQTVRQAVQQADPAATLVVTGEGPHRATDQA